DATSRKSLFGISNLQRQISTFSRRGKWHWFTFVIGYENIGDWVRVDQSFPSVFLGNIAEDAMLLRGRKVLDLLGDRQRGVLVYLNDGIKAGDSFFRGIQSHDPGYLKKGQNNSQP
ncbi:MAG: hypothetical protein UW41_C0019G0001, partial [Candidatus Collierbacteria bacterium GW2011_GWC2_44_18]